MSTRRGTDRTAVIVALFAVSGTARAPAGEPTPGPRPGVTVRGIYGGVPDTLMARGRSLADAGVNAVWIGSGGLTREVAAALRAQGAKVFAEFNTMHDAGYVEAHPEAAPVGPDGATCPAPDGWQGVCPTDPGYRDARMRAFRALLADVPVDGVWLDYHHAQASWEQARPNLPDTCFCLRCRSLFQRDTGLTLPDRPVPELARRLLGPLRKPWVAWRCGVYTGWVREFRQVRDEVRPDALLGSFHCPWTDTDFGGALRDKLGIDLKAQAALLDVLSPMPYHARFGHADDPAWVSRQIDWLGRHLGLKGGPAERPKVWPIVQLADWGEPVPASQVAAVLDHGTRPPATGVLVFAWGGIRDAPGKVERLTATYRAIRPEKTR